MNRYTQIDSVLRDHDENGNLTDNGEYLFCFDYKDRLVEVKRKTDQSLVATYAYDCFGRRVEKHVESSQTTTQYYYEGASVIQKKPEKWLP